jgi:hypothetical protein
MRTFGYKGEEWQEGGENCSTDMYYEDRIKEDRIGLACSTYDMINEFNILVWKPDRGTMLKTWVYMGA